MALQFYPSMDVVNTADAYELKIWSSYLHDPENPIEEQIMERIKERHLQLSGHDKINESSL